MRLSVVFVRKHTAQPTSWSDMQILVNIYIALKGNTVENGWITSVCTIQKL